MIIKKIRNYQAGMTYVELIVVLSIFSIMSGIVMYNYQGFQAKVDIKNLASDIAIKIVEAQKSSKNGVLPLIFVSDTWKPSYGVYFDGVTPPAPLREFIYFVDLSEPSNGYDSGVANEMLDPIKIAKTNYFISKIERCDTEQCSSPTNITTPLSITFKRPNSEAVFYQTSGKLEVTGSQYIQITVKSASENATSLIKVYPSGRIQVN